MKQIKAVVANINDLKNGEMRQVSVGETEILLSRIDGKFYAVGAHCTHYGAPLAKGVLSGHNIVCPWHNACFDLMSGDQLQPPGLDSLAHYEARIEGENVIVSVPEQTTGLRSPTMAQFNPNVDGRTFVILGAGTAGIHAAEALRVAGYQGRIVMITQEDKLPYDRTKLSKAYLSGKASPEEMPLRSPDFFKEHTIEVLLNKQVKQVQTTAKAIAFTDGDSLTYDALLVATGGKPRQLDIPGADLPNIFTLRSFDDANRILTAIKQKGQAVVIGSSFIGMETAAGLTQQGLQVTVVSPDSVPFEKNFGEQIGKLFQQVHEENGVSFKLRRKAVEFAGNGKVEAVILDNGDRLQANIVIVGIGVQPATDFLEGVNLHSKDRSVVVDEYLCAADNVYAAGDIARYPDWRTSESIRVEHWRVAAQQGRIAAHNMAGKAVKFRGLPFFWTMQFKFSLRYIGHAQSWDEIVVDGDLQQQKFIAFYIKNNQVLAVATSHRDTETAAISELMRLNQMPPVEELRRGAVDLIQRQPLVSSKR
ncbi:MAG: FAD-dependent oxidoreductase [Pelatocladus maniniholoensis HA4357-MV3]|jgi:NADPH-dependent 2,4-dienoyl-CoA reductase/sulfur reductase-like enzyme/nitrite reductase/ring-hydroxylating ferredoxin subunit|uniref:FAD-dependent oxidoreductase n=1 Tax=Pelatocladus maniniholoensis HA4357-MV3 TaxID=1117104 RepID=A0A9E3HDK8_9NOST|nr:FAD-dependent oxidoreductase [Pelatocladus maniniholoensis HA4357-MV3]